MRGRRRAPALWLPHSLQPPAPPVSAPQHRGSVLLSLLPSFSKEQLTYCTAEAVERVGGSPGSCPCSSTTGSWGFSANAAGDPVPGCWEVRARLWALQGTAGPGVTRTLVPGSDTLGDSGLAPLLPRGRVENRAVLAQLWQQGQRSVSCSVLLCVPRARVGSAAAFVLRSPWGC